MTFQAGQDVDVVYKLEGTNGTGFGTLAGTASGKKFRYNAGGGFGLTKEAIRSNEVKANGQPTMARHGYRSVSGRLTGDMSLGSYDDFMEAVLRGTFGTASAGTGLTGTNGTIGGTNGTQFTRGSGSFVTDLVRVGDIGRWTGFTGTGTGNNNVNFLVRAVAATTLDVVLNAVQAAASDQAAIFTRAGRTVSMPTTQVSRSFTFEEVNNNIDASEVFTGQRVGSIDVNVPPDGPCTITVNFVGKDQQVMSGSSSPYFVSPTTTTSLAMVGPDAKIFISGVEFTSITGISFTINLSPENPKVVGSATTPEIFTGVASVTGQFTILRDGVSMLNNFINETELYMNVILFESESEPKDFINLFFPRIKSMGNNTDLQATGGMVETVPFEAGEAVSASGVWATTMVIQTSNAS